MPAEGKYVPLSWPTERPRAAGLSGRARKRLRRGIECVVQQRGAIPTEFWGADPRRADVGQRVCTIIKNTVGWTTDNFLPDDPLEILLWDNGDGLCALDAIFQTENQFVVDLPREMISEKIWKQGGTLGWLIDYLLENAACVARWAPAGEGSLESHPCPQFAAFVDIRDFVQNWCHFKRPRLRPSTNLPDALPDTDWKRFDSFLRARFGVPRLIRCRFLGVLPPGRVWLVSCGIAAIAIGKMMAWQFALWLLCWPPAVVILRLIVIWSSRSIWRQRPGTVRQVIEWILAERSRNSEA